MTLFKFQKRRAVSRARHLEELKERRGRVPLDVAWEHRGPDVILACLCAENRRRRQDVRLLKRLALVDDGLHSVRVPG